MKKSINAWSIPGDVSFEKMFADLSSAGFDGVELNLDAENYSSHSLSLSTDDKALSEILSLSKKYNLPISSISTSMYGPETLGSDDKEGRELGKTILRKQLYLAKALNADGILVVPGGITPNRSIKKAYENVYTTFNEMKSEIESGDVFVGVENVWNNFFISPTDMANFIDTLNIKNLGAYFDVGNVLIFSYPEYWIEILGSRIGKIHVKDFLKSSTNAGTFVNLLEGSADWKKVTTALKSIGYDDYITAELSIIERDPEFLYQITSKALDRIFAY